MLIFHFLLQKLENHQLWRHSRFCWYRWLKTVFRIWKKSFRKRFCFHQNKFDLGFVSFKSSSEIFVFFFLSVIFCNICSRWFALPAEVSNEVPDHQSKWSRKTATATQIKQNPFNNRTFLITTQVIQRL